MKAMSILQRLRWSISADTPARYPDIVIAAVDEIERLRAINAELLEALQATLEIAEIMHRQRFSKWNGTATPESAFGKAHVAIAKATGQS